MDKLTFERVLRRAVLIPFFLAAGLAVILFFEVRSFVSTASWVDHTDQVIAVAQRIFRARIDEETGLRAYLLTHDDRFLQPFHAGRNDAEKLEDTLHELIRDNSEQQTRDAQALSAYREWQAFSDDAIARAQLGQKTDATAFQLRGKQLMDAYRAAETEFIAHEEQLREQRATHSHRMLAWVNTTIASLCLITGVIVSLVGRRQLTNLSHAFNAALDEVTASANQARAQREWLETTLRSIGDAVIATNANGTVTFMNSVAEKLTGWTLADAREARLTDVFRIINEHTRETVENPIDKVRRLNQVVGLANHTILISKTGQEFPIDDSGAPIRDARGSIVGIVLVFRDVTQQRTLESALLANEKLAVAGRLSASIAHEIHNPLDTVSNLLFLVRQQTEDRAQVQQMITTAQREIHRVAQISKNMLSLNRQSRACLPVRLPEMLDDVVDLIQEMIAKGKRNIRVEHGFQGEIEAFAAELRQVFTNILKNSVEATKEGGGIRIYSVADQDRGRDGVVVHITDDGSGVSEEMKSRLFMPFATTKQEGGNGLGLWVSRSIVEKHGGNIRISSDGKSGTTVSIFLPLKQRSDGNETSVTIAEEAV